MVAQKGIGRLSSRTQPPRLLWGTIQSVLYQTGAVTLAGAAGGLYAGSLKITLSSPDGAAGTFRSVSCSGASRSSPPPGC